MTYATRKQSGRESLDHECDYGSDVTPGSTSGGQLIIRPCILLCGAFNLDVRGKLLLVCGLRHNFTARVKSKRKVEIRMRGRT